MASIAGIPIYDIPVRAKYALSDKVTVSDEFRKNYNTWLFERFGPLDLIKPGEVLFAKGLFGDSFFTDLVTKKALESMLRKPSDIFYWNP